MGATPQAEPAERVMPSPAADQHVFSSLQQSCDAAAQLLKCLAHPDRLLLACQLAQQEYCVGELERLTGLVQPSLSQQLGVMRKAGIVATRREGKQIFYRLSSEPASAVMQTLYPFFCQPAGGLTRT